MLCAQILWYHFIPEEKKKNLENKKILKTKKILKSLPNNGQIASVIWTFKIHILLGISRMYYLSKETSTPYFLRTAESEVM